jgi:hypothetical protein
MEIWNMSSAGRWIWEATLIAVVAIGLAGFWCGESLAEKPSIRQTRSGETPFVQVEEFVPGVTTVNAEFYAFMQDQVQSQPTTVILQYVTAANYEPTAEEPYARGVTVELGTTSEKTVELHAHLTLAPDQVYRYRVIAKNVEGTFETAGLTVQTYPASQGTLPDGRAYEQVSPVTKNNLDALGQGERMTMQASPDGAAFAYFSFEPFPAAMGTSSLTTDYLSIRSTAPAAWTTQGVQAPIEPIGAAGDEVSGFTEDLTKTIIQVNGTLQINGPPLGSPGIFNAYVRDNVTGTYQILADNVGSVPLLFVDAARDDAHILFETEQQLLPAAVASKVNLYEWDEDKPEGERVTLVGVLPDAECTALSEPSGCAPSEGSGAGAGGTENLRGTISEDGSRIFFTGYPSGRLYEREPLNEPSPITIPVSSGMATFLTATPSGEYVFYTEGGELYRFDTATKARQALSSGAEGVPGTLGVSDDGTYAYFVAKGTLAANENANREKAVQGDPNLYEWHENPTTHADGSTFIARLLFPGPGSEPPGDEADWLGADRTSRVNPSGTALLFMSQAPITGYDNGQSKSSACNESVKQIPCSELFLYEAGEPLSPTNPVCVSCNPRGTAAVAPARLTVGEIEVALPGPRWTSHLTRNLSADGARVFFESMEALVPGDINGVSDVYEWERERVGSCQSGRGHCLYLISSGTAHAKSFFGDASESGNDVFFFTRQPLVGQDDDLNFDVYDARVGGGIAAQNPPVDHCEGDGCKPDAGPAPVSGSPGSDVLTGIGNQIAKPKPEEPKPTKCTKGLKLSHGKCVKIKCAKRKRLDRGKCVKIKSNIRKTRKTAKSRQGRGER